MPTDIQARPLPAQKESWATHCQHTDSSLKLQIADWPAAQKRPLLIGHPADGAKAFFACHAGDAQSLAA